MINRSLAVHLCYNKRQIRSGRALKLKIAIIVWDLNISGGTQRQALELAHRLSEWGHHLKVYCGELDRKLCYPELLNGLEIVALDKTKVTPSKLRTMFAKLPVKRPLAIYNRIRPPFMDQAQRLADLIEDTPEVINGHDSPAHQVAALYKKKYPGCRAVWMSNDLPWAFQVLQRRGRPGPKQWLKYLGQTGLLRFEVLREAGFIRQIDQIVVLDNHNRQLFWQFLRRRVIVIRSGLNPADFKPKFEKHNQIFTVLATGIFFPYRRFEDLIEAVAALKRQGKKTRLKIIGTDQFAPAYGQKLRELVKDLDIEGDVSFLGRVSETELHRQYQEADVFVFPNQQQTWGLAPIEALASGTPVIVSKTAGVHEVLEDGQTALLVAPMQPAELAAKIGLLMNEPSLRQRLARQGYEFVRQNISWDKYANQMQAVLKSSLNFEGGK